MLTSMMFSAPLALIWMLVTENISLGSLFIGLLIGLAISLLLRSESTKTTWRKLPDQGLALVIYTITLFRDIWLSSVDVAKRVLNPELPMNPGILAVPTQDATRNDVIAAFSAHGITITPGELVVDFDPDADTMYVHCLDMDASSQNAPGAQTKRLALLRRILGQTAPPIAPAPVPNFVEASE